MDITAPKLEMINARLGKGTGARIDKVLYGGELRSAFIRMAIEKELRHREKNAGRKLAPSRTAA